MEKVHPWCGQPWDRGRLKNIMLYGCTTPWVVPTLFADQGKFGMQRYFMVLYGIGFYSDTMVLHSSTKRCDTRYYFNVR